MATQKIHTLSSQIEKRTCFYLFIKKKLLNLIFYHVELRKELTFHWYFVWKLKISIFCWTKSETKLFWYLFSQRNLMNLISIKSNWKKTLFFIDLLNGNSKNSYFIKPNQNKNLFLKYLFIKKKPLNLTFYVSSEIWEGACFSLIFCG